MYGVVEYYYILICMSKRRKIFLGILYGYKAAMQVIALILAFTTRKVKVKGLNDALYIAAAIYITSLLWAIVILSTYTLTEYLNVFVTVFCLGLLVGTTAIISLVFIPKVWCAMLISIILKTTKQKVANLHYINSIKILIVPNFWPVLYKLNKNGYNV